MKKDSNSHYFWAVKAHKREAGLGCLEAVETLPRGKETERHTDQNGLNYPLPFIWAPEIAHLKLF